MVAILANNEAFKICHHRSIHKKVTRRNSPWWQWSLPTIMALDSSRSSHSKRDRWNPRSYPTPLKTMWPTQEGPKSRKGWCSNCPSSSNGCTTYRDNNPGPDRNCKPSNHDVLWLWEWGSSHTTLQSPPRSAPSPTSKTCSSESLRSKPWTGPSVPCWSSIPRSKTQSSGECARRQRRSTVPGSNLIRCPPCADLTDHSQASSPKTPPPPWTDSTSLGTMDQCNREQASKR